MIDYLSLADKSLSGVILNSEECLSVLMTPPEKMLDLLQAAFKVREAYFGRKVIVQLLVNARSGSCSEDCAYCSQSALSTAEIDKYPLINEEEILAGAQAARKAKAVRYCIVTSGRAPGKENLERICRAASRIKRDIGISLCASLGFLDEKGARALKSAGIDRYNHNLNTSKSFYPGICSTHTYDERKETIFQAHKSGLELCSGALLGMGESDEDIIELAFALREFKPESIPVNFLHPVTGTALEKVDYLTPVKCLAILCLFRFINPQSELRASGGREYHLRSLQPLALYPANSIFVSGYLTTSGQKPEEAWKMIKDMGFEVEEEITRELAIK